MNLAERIATDMKTAMKAKNSATLSTLRLLRSAMKNKQIDVQHELSDQEVVGVIKSQMKQLKDSLDSFLQAHREDLVVGVQAEIRVLETYLPAELSEEQLTEIVKGAIEQTGATSKADAGKVMGVAMKAVAGQADGNRVKMIVEQLLVVVVLAVVGVFTDSQQLFAAIPIMGETTESIGWFEVGLRAFRALVLWGGIYCIIQILKGGFEYTTASMRDDAHKGAIGKITNGLVGSIVVAGLFSIATVFLNQLF